MTSVISYRMTKHIKTLIFMTVVANLIGALFR